MIRVALISWITSWVSPYFVEKTETAECLYCNKCRISGPALLSRLLNVRAAIITGARTKSRVGGQSLKFELAATGMKEDQSPTSLPPCQAFPTLVSARVKRNTVTGEALWVCASKHLHKKCELSVLESKERKKILKDYNSDVTAPAKWEEQKSSQMWTTPTLVKWWHHYIINLCAHEVWTGLVINRGYFIPQDLLSN